MDEGLQSQQRFEKWLGDVPSGTQDIMAIDLDNELGVMASKLHPDLPKHMCEDIYRISLAVDRCCVTDTDQRTIIDRLSNRRRMRTIIAGLLYVGFMVHMYQSNNELLMKPNKFKVIMLKYGVNSQTINDVGRDILAQTGALDYSTLAERLQ